MSKSRKVIGRTEDMIEVLFIKNNPEQKHMAERMPEAECNVTEYEFHPAESAEPQSEYLKLVRYLREHAYHMLVSINYDEILANAGFYGGTRYIALQSDVSGCVLSSAYANCVTNYIIVNEWSAYAQLQRAGILSVYYCPFDMKEIVQLVISEEELSIYRTYYRLKEWRDTEGALYDECEIINKEKDMMLVLKEQCVHYLDSLMVQHECKAWDKMESFFYGRIGRECVGNFWELYLMGKLLEEYAAGKKERDLELFVQRFSSVEEIWTEYFKMLFLLRRLEYDIPLEDAAGAVDFVYGNPYQSIIVNGVLHSGQIYDKAKVIGRLKELWQVHGNE